MRVCQSGSLPLIQYFLSEIRLPIDPEVRWVLPQTTMKSCFVIAVVFKSQDVPHLLTAVVKAGSLEALRWLVDVKHFDPTPRFPEVENLLVEACLTRNVDIAAFLASRYNFMMYPLKEVRLTIALIE